MSQVGAVVDAVVEDMSEPTECPKCHTDFRYVVKGKTYLRVISIYDRAKDRTIEWMCPDCDYRWPRGK